MNIKKLITLSFSLILTASACKKAPIASSNPPIEVTKDSTVVTQQPILPVDSIQKVDIPVVPTPDSEFKIDEIDFKYFKAKSKVFYKSPKESHNVTVNFRIKKDSIIWAAITHPLAGEVIRVRMSRDSVEILDNFNKTYTVLDYKSLSEQFNFELTYDIMQSLIVGNQPLKKKGKTTKGPNYLLLRQDEGKVTVDNYIGDNHKLKKLMLTQQPTNNKMTMDFEDFEALNSYLFPNSSLITVDYQNEQDKKYYQTILQLKYTKVELLDEPLEFPFKIPEKYTKN